jgi:radical SAM superfamily enzyme YgiQ (UPF0313 family)
MKILFIYPHIGQGRKKTPEVKRYFPWGPATVVRHLELDGHAVEILDIYGNDYLPPEVEQRLDASSFDAACISGFASYNYPYVLWLAEQVKQRRSVPVVVGGVLADMHYPLLLSKPVVDVCVLGEGELTAVDLFRYLDHLDRVSGIAYRRDDRVTVNAPRPPIANLDDLPLPDFKPWNMPEYLKANLWADDTTTEYRDYENLPPIRDLHPNFSLFFGRGCPFHCHFCSRSYQNVRYKSVDRIISEIAYFKEHYGVKAVHFYDELVVFRRDTMREFCSKVKALDIYWDCQGRVNTVDRELMAMMKDAHCYSIGFGFESGSDTMLRAMNKGVSKEQNLQVLKAARDVGMHLKIQLMCGYPGETRETLAETVDMMKTSGLPPRRMSWTTPLPGSQIHEDARSQGLIPDEEDYLVQLGRYTMNHPDHIILNISGLPDRVMSRLFLKAHWDMEVNYLLSQLAARPWSLKSWLRLLRLPKKRLSNILWIRRLYKFFKR